MQSIGVRDLKERTSEILRQVREKGTGFEITYHGRVVARLSAVTEPAEAARDPEAFWQNWDRLSEAIGAHWSDGVTAVEAVREGRRDL